LALLFIRVELRGNPSWQDYDNLHAYMEKNNWYRKIQGTAGESSLPHAMYHGNSDEDISALTSALRKGIQASVWTPGRGSHHLCADMVHGTGLATARRPPYAARAYPPLRAKLRD
jgi:hypothetical protein